MDRSINQRFNQ